MSNITTIYIDNKEYWCPTSILSASGVLFLANMGPKEVGTYAVAYLIPGDIPRFLADNKIVQVVEGMNFRVLLAEDFLIPEHVPEATLISDETITATT